VTDFLTRLVERTLGVADIARPDLASLTSVAAAASVGREDRAGDEMLPSNVARGPWLAADALSPADMRRRGRVVRPAVEEPLGATAVPSEHAVVTRPSSPPREGELLAAPPHALVRVKRTGVQARALQQPLPGAPSAESQVTASPVGNASQTGRTPTTTPVTGIRGDRVETPSEVSPEPRGQRAAPPMINITIGRIDVRSAPAAPREHAPVAPAGPPPLRSLETYLRERNGSRP
jgi:hypothetical protein